MMKYKVNEICGVAYNTPASLYPVQTGAIFVTPSNKYRTGYQADVTTSSLVSFALVMAAEAVETSAATSFPSQISNNLPLFTTVKV